MSTIAATTVSIVPAAISRFRSPSDNMPWGIVPLLG
jgi:hypothetical protein